MKKDHPGKSRSMTRKLPLLGIYLSNSDTAHLTFTLPTVNFSKILLQATEK